MAHLQGERSSEENKHLEAKIKVWNREIVMFICKIKDIVIFLHFMAFV